MALVVAGSIGACVLSLDVVGGQVRGGQVVNNDPTRTAWLVLDRIRGSRTITVDIAPGQTFTQSLPAGQRFPYDSTNPEDPAVTWSWSMGWR